MSGQKWVSMRKNQLLSMRGVGSPVYSCVQRPSNALSCWPNSWLSNLHEQMQLRPSLMAPMSPSLFCRVLQNASALQSLCILSIYSAGMSEDNISPKTCLTHSSFGKIYKHHSHSVACPIQDSKHLSSKSQIILKGWFSGNIPIPSTYVMLSGCCGWPIILGPERC